MLNWAKHTLGVTEPIYGPSAIQSVAQQTETIPYTELKKDDLAWECMDSTCVETKTFYMMSDSGRIGLVQVIYSNVMGVRTTAQFSTKIFSSDPTAAQQSHLWSSDNLHNFSFSPDRQQFQSDACSMNLSDDGKSYTIKSSTNKSSVVDLTFTQAAQGLVVGKDGTSYFGTDPKKPWGRMIHKFWPRCRVEGQILTKDGPVDFAGTGIFIHCLQGMKPHFAAARWNFANFHSPNYAAIMMQFTTPPSYGETSVTVGCVIARDQILITGADPDIKAEHTSVKGDPENNWPEPSAARFTWKGKSSEGKEVTAVLEDDLGARTDRVDVMGELPKFVKAIVAGASGAKPYIYQYVPKMKLRVDVGGQVEEEEGQLFMEATFIS